MTNSNLQSVIIRIAFAKGSDEIYVGKTQKGNYTFVGEILHSSDLVISHYNKLIEVNGASCVDSVGTVCIADNNEAHRLIEEIESIQAGRPVNARGNKYPFVFLRVVTDGDIIFNRGVGGEAHRLTFLDVELVEVEAEAPDEVIGINNPILPVAPTTKSAYGTVRYRRPRPQVQGARASICASTDVGSSDERAANKDDISVVNLTLEEKEILLLGGINPNEMMQLSRERADRLIAILKVHVAHVAQTV